MGGLQERNRSYRVIFRYQGQKRSFTLGKVAHVEAVTHAGRIHLLPLRISHGLLYSPERVSIEDVLRSEGQRRPKSEAEAKKADGLVPFSEFRDRYLAARSGGSMEANSLATARMHLKHFERSLGAGFDMRRLALSDLQRHLNSRREAGD